jgi:hypothetical protein
MIKEIFTKQNTYEGRFSNQVIGLMQRLWQNLPTKGDISSQKSPKS